MNQSQLGRSGRFRRARFLVATIEAGIVVAVFSGGCVSDQAARYYVAERYPAKEPSDVEVLWGEPPRSYVVIADFQARGASPEYMRREAAEIGADAVIVGTFGGYRDGSDEWAGEDSQARSYSRIVGTAIKYTE